MISIAINPFYAEFIPSILCMTCIPFVVNPNTTCPCNISLVRTRINVVWAALLQSRGLVTQWNPALVTVVFVHKQLSVLKKPAAIVGGAGGAGCPLVASPRRIHPCAVQRAALGSEAGQCSCLPVG
jgi:hypothetical protein